MPILLFLFALIFYPRLGLPAPLPAPSNTTVETTGWKSEPTTRGTFRLIFSYLTTLTACVYTAVHLNVPARGITTAARYTRKARWVVLGVLAPEFVVYTAWAQWHSATRLRAEVNGFLDEIKKNVNADADPEREHWTLTHAFYAGMGGFVIDVKPFEGQEYIAGFPRLTVTARGAQFLALNGIIPEISKSSIMDRSKASAFAKVFACTQGGWLVLQTIARLCYKLPITLLEINTVGHVLCALLIYWFWLSKPLGIEEPTVLSELEYPNLPSLCALMWMNSSVSEKAIKRHPKASKSGTELSSLLFFRPLAKYQADHALNDGIENPPSNRYMGGPGGATFTAVSFGDEDAQMTLRQGQVLRDTGFAPNPRSSRFTKSVFSTLERLNRRMGLGTGPHIPKLIELDRTDVRRWQLASQVLASTPSLLEKSNFKELEAKTENGFLAWKFKELLCTRARDWPGSALEGREATLFHLRDRLSFNRFTLFLALATAIYGGLHAAAWNGYFPTTTERIWWRYSSIAVGASGSAFIAITWLASTINYVIRSGFWVTPFQLIIQYLAFFGMLGLGIAFVVSRTYLIVEAFISFRRLPVDAYTSPAWLQALVHI